jgi:hypothetical protein
LTDKNSFKPDFLLNAKPWSHKYNLVAVEVKPCSGVNNGDIIDFSKLGIELKIMLDFIIKNNSSITNPEVFGILFQGNTT